MKPLKVCIVGLKCYDHLVGNPVPRYLGGIETQLGVLAKGLANQGCEVSVITYDHGQKSEEVMDGISILKAYRPHGGIKFLRNFHPRATRLWHAMRKADADVYLQMGSGFETWLVASGVRKLKSPGSRFVFCMASDGDIAASAGGSLLDWEARLYRKALQSADCRIAQTLQQKNSLFKQVGLSSTVIPMAVTGSLQVSSKGGQQSKNVLWVGRIMETKRLELLLEIAKKCPSYSFDVVGSANRESPYAAAVLRKAAKAKNVRVHGKVSNEALDQLYSESLILCSTSELEGFPTTFLEAWSRGLPVLTTIDPDGVVAKSGAGWVASDPAELARILETIGDHGDLHERAVEAAKSHFQLNHTVEGVSRRFKGAFERLLECEAGLQPAATAIH